MTAVQPTTGTSSTDLSSTRPSAEKAAVMGNGSSSRVPGHARGPDTEATAGVITPHLRGWFHLVMTPLAITAGIVLVILSPDTPARIGAITFTVTAGLLFATSATYHRGTWTPAVQRRLKRLDHSNIFLIIAGTYTPVALILLDQTQATILLSLVWGGAILGMAFRICWIGAPRWLYVPIYLALGWVAIFYLGPFARAGGPTVITLIAIGGILYTLGAIVYGTKHPDPSPRWFGFHEIFHTLTTTAFITHYIAISIATYTNPTT